MLSMTAQSQIFDALDVPAMINKQQMQSQVKCIGQSLIGPMAQ